MFAKNAVFAVVLIGCAPVEKTREAPTVSGGAMLNVQPIASPGFIGNYDFDLLDPVRGKACVRANSSGPPREYWMAALPFQGKPPGDTVTVGAIAAASTDAIDQIAGADTILLTRVITEGKSSDEVCAYVYGRAVRLKKAQDKPAVKQDHNEDDLSDPSKDRN